VSGLEDWARLRAPELVRQAEAEAVAVLRQALVDTALGEMRKEPAKRTRSPQDDPPAPTPKRDVEGHALWTYCVIRSGDPLPDPIPGVDSSAEVEQIEEGGLVALASRVPLADFSEEPLRENLNNLPWLGLVARAHEAVLERVLGRGPIVPLRLCTIYDDDAGVRAMLSREHEALSKALERLDGRTELGVKLLVDREALAEAARKRSPELAALEEELETRSEGGAYMLGRRVERNVAEVADQLAADLADDVHARISDCAADAVLNPPQNRELSGHDGEMLLNGAYLVEAGRTAELRGLLAELEQRHSDLGARLELTGPWPPYNFVSRVAGAPA
jgi:gas vesicle protein GvpL/GvpF